MVTAVMYLSWALVKEFGVGYHKKETRFFTIDPYDGNLDEVPLHEPSLRQAVGILLPTRGRTTPLLSSV